MTPILEVGHIRAVVPKFPNRFQEQGELVIVVGVGQDGRDISRRVTSSDVLTIASAAGGQTVPIDA